MTATKVDLERIFKDIKNQERLRWEYKTDQELLNIIETSKDKGLRETAQLELNKRTQAERIYADSQLDNLRKRGL